MFTNENWLVITRVEYFLGTELPKYTFNEKQNWKSHLYGKGGLIASLNSRLFALKRLKNHISQKSIEKVADGLFTSKLRYGLQLFGKVRRSIEDPTNEDFTELQRMQNKMMRLVSGTSIQDRISIRNLLEMTNNISVNQMNAQIKIQEIWKALNINHYPLTVTKYGETNSALSTRSCSNGKLVESGKCVISQKSCKNDAIRLWNSLPKHIQTCETLNEIKTQTKIYVRSLPV